MLPEIRKFFTRRPFIQYLLILFILLILGVIITLTVMDYQNEQRTFERNLEVVQTQTEEDIAGALKLVDESYKVYDNTMNKQLKEDFVVFLEEYNKSGRDPALMDLESLKSRMGENIDLYIINDTGVIEYTTYRPELGLDFKSVPYFYDYLNQIRVSEGYFPDRVVRETATRKLRKFAYMPTPDHRYILELGLTGEPMITEHGSIEYEDVLQKIGSHNPYLQEIQVFNSKGQRIGNVSSGEAKEVNPGALDAINLRQGIEVTNSTNGDTIKYIFIDLKDPNYGSDPSLVVGLTYNNNLAEETLQKQLLARILLTLVILIICIFVVYAISKTLTKPIEEIVDDVDQIAKGELDHHVKPTTGLEFAKLEQSINAMVSTLKATIRRQQDIEAELRISEERYKLVSDLISDYAYAIKIDSDGSYVPEWATGAFQQIFGISTEEFLNARDWIAFTHPEDRELYREHRTRLLNNESHVSEFRVLGPGGTIHWVHHMSRPVWDETQHRTVRFFAAGQDITARKNAELERTRIQKSVEASSDAIGILDPLGVHLYQNPAFTRMFGYETPELAGPPGLLTLFVDPTIGQEVFSAIMRGESWKGEVSMVSKDGRHFPISLSADAAKDDHGEIIGLIVIFTDISERKRAEEYLRLLNEELEVMVANRTSQLETVNKELESFSYMVSHDLRAPLRSIDGFSRIVLEEYSDRLPEQGIHYLNLVRDSASQMRSLIDSLLNFSHMSRKSLQIMTVYPEDIARESYEGLRNEWASRNVEFIVEDLPPCQADPVMLKLVYSNLISNALKFTRTRENPKIEVGAFKKEGTTVYFVKDNGIGFDMRYNSKLFTVFQRLHPVAEFEGSGLGLAIVQRIIHRHGGRVWAEAEVERGATFFFTIDGGKVD